MFKINNSLGKAIVYSAISFGLISTGKHNISYAEPPIDLSSITARIDEISKDLTQIEALAKFNIPQEQSEEYLSAKKDLSAWHINSLIKKDVTPEEVREFNEQIPSFSGYDIADLISKGGTLEEALEIKSIFPEALGFEIGSLIKTLKEINHPLSYVKDYKDRVESLTASGVNELIRANIAPDQLEQYNQYKSIDKSLTTSNIVKLMIIGFKPEDGADVIKFDSLFKEKPYYFNGITVLSYDRNITLSEEPTKDVTYIDFTDENKSKFISNATEKLPIPYELYLMIGSYGLCPNYNQEDFKEFINEQLKLNNISLEEVSNMHPYDAIDLAVKITMDCLDYYSVDFDPKYENADLLTLLKKGKGDCDKYTKTFIGIAYYFKELNPELNNIYFVEGNTLGGILDEHSWPVIVIALNDSTFKVSHIDPTFFDGKQDLQSIEWYHYTEGEIQRDLGIKSN